MLNDRKGRVMTVKAAGSSRPADCTRRDPPGTPRKAQVDNWDQEEEEKKFACTAEVILEMCVERHDYFFFKEVSCS